MAELKPVVWDVFPYHNESLILDVRRRELRDDRFTVEHVPIEASLTLMGAPREWALDDSMKIVTLPGDTPVAREDVMRRACEWALHMRDAGLDDYVLFGDVDEIPHGGAIVDAMDRDAMDGPRVRCLRLPYHSLLATRRLPLKRDAWNFRWPLIGTLREFMGAGDWATLRACSGSFERIDDAGWHLSSMGGPDAVLAKISAFAHAGESWTVGLDADRLRDLATRGRDVADRFTQDQVPAWELPLALIEDPDRYRVLLEVCW